MRLRVRILRRAQADLHEIDQYLRVDAPDRRGPLVEELLNALARLERHPLLGPVTRDKRLSLLGYRYLYRRPYVIFYKVLRAQIRVYRVLHERRAYWDLL